MPVPRGMVTDSASRTPSIALTATVCPIERPGPKLVYVTPDGASASIRARTTESDPGSHPAEITLTAPPSTAALPSDWRKAGTCVWMSKLSTVFIPSFRIFTAVSSTFREGVARIATSTSFSSDMSATTGYADNSAGQSMAP